MTPALRRTETPRLGWPINQDSAVEGYGGRPEISPAPRAGVFPGAALRGLLRALSIWKKTACLLRRDEVKAVATPKAKAHTHRGTMVVDGMTGSDAMINTHTAAAVNAKESGTAGHAQLHG